jgi:predicted HTH domain antitoxin
MSKTMSIRMDRDNYEFLHDITKEERSDLSKAVRDLVTRGRILLAVERYKKGEASLGRAAELAGLPLGQMITILTEFGVESRLERKTTSRGLEISIEYGDNSRGWSSASTSMLSLSGPQGKTGATKKQPWLLAFSN